MIRTLDHQGFVSAQDPRTFPTNDIRRLEASSGNPNAIIGGTQDQSGDIGTQVLDLLKNYQKFGRQQEVAGQEQQINRISQTQPNLIGANPALQSSVRNASVQAIEPTIGGARDLIAESKALMQEYQDVEEKNMVRAQSLIEAAVSTGSAGLEELIAVNPDIFKKAGLDAKSFGAVLKGLKAKEAAEKQQQDIDNQLKRQQLAVSSASLKMMQQQEEQQKQQQKVINEASDIINITRELLGSDLSGITGGLRIQGFIPATQSRSQRLSAEQLKAKLTVSEREKLKGSGAISDFEAQMLGKSATALDFSMSEEVFKRELSKIQGVFQTALGGTAPVRVTSPDGQTKTGQLSRDEINSAVGQGFQVEYIGQ